MCGSRDRCRPALPHSAPQPPSGPRAPAGAPGGGRRSDGAQRAPRPVAPRPPPRPSRVRRPRLTALRAPGPRAPARGPLSRGGRFRVASPPRGLRARPSAAPRFLPGSAPGLAPDERRLPMGARASPTSPITGQIRGPLQGAGRQGPSARTCDRAEPGCAGAAGGAGRAGRAPGELEGSAVPRPSWA